MTPGLDNVQTKYRRLIDARLARSVAGIVPAELRAPIAHVVDAGGKRLRPVMTMLACDAAGGAARSAVDAAVAVELLHTFTLVHDDIMDRAALRRGRATVHEKWNANTAILAGDTIAALALESLARTNAARHAAINRLFARAFVQVCEGQAIDKTMETARSVSMDEYLNMIGLKTAAMFAMAAGVGGAVATDDDRLVRALYRFGWEVGLAFQIRDDALDIDADMTRLGKDSGGDIREGKKSYLFVAARAAVTTAADRRVLSRYVEEHGARGARAVAIRDLYIRCGALTRAERDIAARAARARAALRMIPPGPPRDRIIAMAGALTERRF